MRLEPKFARVLLERERPEKLGSIYVPDEVQKRNATTRCKVIAVGPTADKSIEVGTTVLIGQHAGTWVNLSGRAVPDPKEPEWYLVSDEDILCEVTE